jgi:hypothetical protein
MATCQHTQEGCKAAAVLGSRSRPLPCTVPTAAAALTPAAPFPLSCCRRCADLLSRPVPLSPAAPFLVSPRAQWNLLQFLPPEVAGTAELVLAEFMYRPWVAAATAAMAGATQGGSQAAADARDALQVQVSVVRYQCLCFR